MGEVIAKRCRECGHEKPITEFIKGKGYADGYRHTCKACKSEYNKRYRIQNIDAISAYNKSWAEQNSEQVKEYAKNYRQNQLEQNPNINKDRYIRERERRLNYAAIYRAQNKEKVRECIRLADRKRNTYNADRRLVLRLRTRLYLVLRGSGVTKDKTTFEFIGCTVEFLKQHLASKFKEGMTFENYGEWHIDHKIPCASFNLHDPVQRAKCFHYSNLQPLWAQENLSKGARII